jgi:hypothetical protein
MKYTLAVILLTKRITVIGSSQAQMALKKNKGPAVDSFTRGDITRSARLPCVLRFPGPEAGTRR